MKIPTTQEFKEQLERYTQEEMISVEEICNINCKHKFIVMITVNSMGTEIKVLNDGNFCEDCDREIKEYCEGLMEILN